MKAHKDIILFLRFKKYIGFWYMNGMGGCVRVFLHIYIMN